MGYRFFSKCDMNNQRVLWAHVLPGFINVCCWCCWCADLLPFVYECLFIQQKYHRGTTGNVLLKLYTRPRTTSANWKETSPMHESVWVCSGLKASCWPSTHTLDYSLRSRVLPLKQKLASVGVVWQQLNELVQKVLIQWEKNYRRGAYRNRRFIQNLIALRWMPQIPLLHGILKTFGQYIYSVALYI